MRQTGEGLSGTEGKSDVISEEDNATASKLYGREYVIKTPEEQQAVIDAQNKAVSFAVQTGVVIPRNGNYYLNPNAKPEDVKAVSEVEKDLLLSAGGKSLMDKGVVTALVENLKEERNIRDADKKSESISNAQRMAYQKQSDGGFWHNAVNSLARAYAANSMPSLTIAKGMVESGKAKSKKKIEDNNKRIKKDSTSRK